MNPLKNIPLTAAMCLTLISCSSPSTTASDRTPGESSNPKPVVESARVVIDAADHLHQVNPLIFGMHIEWVESGLGLFDERSNRLRPEVLELLLPLEIPLFRFPGGIHADYYDWRMGVGVSESRMESSNVFNGATEEHRFGSREFVDLLAATGAQGLITANVGTGTAPDAGAWAAYLQDEESKVELWEVGNETYLCDPKGDQPNGRKIYRSPDAYAKAFPKFRKAIRAANPGAMVGAIAHVDSGAFPLAPAAIRHWSEEMLRALRGKADFVSVHNAYAPVILDNSVDFEKPEERLEAYRSFYAAANQTVENLQEIGSLIDTLSPANKGIPLAVTEFGPFFGLSSKRKIHAQYVDQTRTLAAALYTASILHVLIDNPRVMMACYTNPIHRWYGSLLTDTDEGLITTPTYHLYALYRSRFETQLVGTSVTSPTFNAPQIGIVKKHGQVPDLLAQSATSEDGRRLTVLMTNRSTDRTLETTLVIEGFEPSELDCQVLTASSPAAINGPAVSESTIVGETIKPQPLPCATGPEIKLVVPANSIVSLVAARN